MPLWTLFAHYLNCSYYFLFRYSSHLPNWFASHCFYLSQISDLAYLYFYGFSYLRSKWDRRLVCAHCDFLINFLAYLDYCNSFSLDYFSKLSFLDECLMQEDFLCWIRLVGKDGSILVIEHSENWIAAD